MSNDELAAHETVAAAWRVLAFARADEFERCAGAAWRAAGRCERLGAIGWARTWRAFADECDGPGYAGRVKWLSGAVRLKAAAEAALGGLRAVTGSCPVCDRAACRGHESATGAAECAGNAVDWRARALAAEAGKP